MRPISTARRWLELGQALKKADLRSVNWAWALALRQNNVTKEVKHVRPHIYRHKCFSVDVGVGVRVGEAGLCVQQI